MKNNTAPTLIAVAGSSGAGKTSVAEEIAHRLNQDNPGSCIVISSDRYYRDRPDLSFSERCEVNYDHPDSIEFSLCRLQLQALKSGRAVHAPNYAFDTHSRTAETTRIDPAGVNVIVLEGILLLADAANLTDLCDVKIFVESTPKVCLQRRVERDMQVRGRTEASVREQYEATVGPMDVEFVRPSRANADLVVKNSMSMAMETRALRFDLNPVMRYLEPTLAAGPSPMNQCMWRLFQSQTEIELTRHAGAEVAGECHDDLALPRERCFIY